MSQDDDVGETVRENGGPSGQDSVDAAGEPKEVASPAAPPAAGETREAISENLTLETLNRYLATAAEDRDAAEERSSQVIARFTKLTIAVMCLTMVIAGANVAMIIRQSNTVQPIVVAPPRPVETPTVLVQPAQPILPAPVPTELEGFVDIHSWSGMARNALRFSVRFVHKQISFSGRYVTCEGVMRKACGWMARRSR